MKAGQAAADKKDYETVVKQADEALRIKPGDSTATALKRDAEGQIQTAKRQRDYQSAEDDFAKGNYGAALQFCEKYTGNDKNFETLAKSIQAEQKLFENAKRDTSNEDYSAFDRLKEPLVLNKPPVQALMKQAEKEQADLKELRDMRSKTNWPGVQGKLKNIPSESLLRKAPFDDLRKWANAESDKHEQRTKAQAARLNNELECFKVWFGLASSDRNVVIPQGQGFADGGKKPQQLGTIGFAGKAFYEDRLKKLQAQYEKPLTPVLEKTFRDLKTKIDNWE